jgi:hypothetical protein
MEKKDKHRNHDPKTGTFVKGNQAHELRENPGGKPKISRFIEEFACVLDEPHPVGNAIIFSDKELVFLTNRRLKPEERIADNTFTNWKKYEFKSEKDQKEAEAFREMYEEHLLLQR